MKTKPFRQFNPIIQKKNHRIGSFDLILSQKSKSEEKDTEKDP
jgi:hypothetical protein